MISLFIRNLFFTILQPGLVAGLIPYLFVKRERNEFVRGFRFHHYTGLFIFIAGIVITISCIVSFAMKGKGTLSPADPTKQLVVTQLYKYSRNPMYAGVMLILIAEAIFFRVMNLWVYAVIVFIAFNLFIIFFEEPRLRKDFGSSYESYCRKTREVDLIIKADLNFRNVTLILSDN